MQYIDLPQLSIGSLLLILNQSDFSPYIGYIAVSLANLGNTDPTIGRSYNVFTSLKSSERKALGFINYDMSAALQVISAELLIIYSPDPDLLITFSTLFKYAYQTDFKNKFRNTISHDLGWSLNEVKSLLTAYANGSSRDADKHPLLRQFSDDSDRLRREVISVIAKHEPDVLALALSQTRHDFDSEMDWTSTVRLDDAVERQKSSVFFFIWTYYEKQIRDAMLTLVPDGIPVHDAIYSRHEVPLLDFKAAIEQQTGFGVRVSH
jgi:hypothetical protein